METLPQGLVTTGAESLFYLLLLSAVVFGLVLAYHWFLYGTSRFANVLALGLYTAGSAIALLVMFISMNSF